MRAIFLFISHDWLILICYVVIRAVRRERCNEHRS